MSMAEVYVGTMPAHRSHTVASARAARTPARRDSHHRVRSIELAHSREHEHAKLHRGSAF